jgi:RNase P/RNase MRP subunit p29
MAFKYAHTDDPRAGLFEVTGRIVHETDKALLLDDGTVREWVPKSKVKVEQRRDGTVEVAMPEWLARDKGYV